MSDQQPSDLEQMAAITGLDIDALTGANSDPSLDDVGDLTDDNLDGNEQTDTNAKAGDSISELPQKAQEVNLALALYQQYTKGDVGYVEFTRTASAIVTDPDLKISLIELALNSIADDHTIGVEDAEVGAEINLYAEAARQMVSDLAESARHYNYRIDQSIRDIISRTQDDIDPGLVLLAINIIDDENVREATVIDLVDAYLLARDYRTAIMVAGFSSGKNMSVQALKAGIHNKRTNNVGTKINRQDAPAIQ